MRPRRYITSPCAMWVDAIRPHVGGLAAASALSGAANLLFRSFPNSRKVVEGVPLYLFFVAMLFQLFVYPHFAWSAWKFTGYDDGWFSQGWGADPMGAAKQHERVWLYAMFGFMMKDMWIFRNDLLFFLHHGIAMAGVLTFFTVPAGLGQFLVGGTVLEMGNLTYNIVLLKGKDSGPNVSPTVKHLAEVLYAIGMGVSNYVGARMFATFTKYDGLKGTYWPWGLGFMWFALIAGRSHVHLSRSWPYFAQRWGGKGKGKAKGKGKSNVRDNAPATVAEVRVTRSAKSRR